MSRHENIKPYYIYNDKPKNLNKLKQVSGFGEKKTEKYGVDILNILSKQS